MSKFFKQSEFAPGIPDRKIKASLPNISSPQEWSFVIQKHDALRAGTHFDLRLGDPKAGQAHSWALRQLPQPGEKTLAVLQPTHTTDYMKFQGNIPSGYGAGDVSTHILDKTEIIESSPNQITFYLYDEATPKKFTLMQMDGNNWLLINHSTTQKLTGYFNKYPRQDYKELKSKSEILTSDFITPKIDGALALTILRPGKTPVVYGRRLSKRTGAPIEYTPKLFNLMTHKPPKDLGTTILRTEVYGITPDGKELPNRTLGGLLNSNVWKSRESQKSLGVPLRLAAHDVLVYKGRDVSKQPIEERYKIIDEISKKYPIIENPLDVAKRIHFPEGNVIWRNNIPYKFKNRPDFDVFVKGIYPNINGDRAGGFTYSHTEDGPVVGNIGTGFTHKELTNMLSVPDDYIGRKAKVLSQERLPSGALRAPSFSSWHPDFLGDNN